jgi:hypothetical protein
MRRGYPRFPLKKITAFRMAYLDRPDEGFDFIQMPFSIVARSGKFAILMTAIVAPTLALK